MAEKVGLLGSNKDRIIEGLKDSLKTFSSYTDRATGERVVGNPLDRLDKVQKEVLAAEPLRQLKEQADKSLDRAGLGEYGFGSKFCGWIDQRVDWIAEVQNQIDLVNEEDRVAGLVLERIFAGKSTVEEYWKGKDKKEKGSQAKADFVAKFRDALTQVNEDWVEKGNPWPAVRDSLEKGIFVTPITELKSDFIDLTHKIDFGQVFAIGNCVVVEKDKRYYFYKIGAVGEEDGHRSLKVMDKVIVDQTMIESTGILDQQWSVVEPAKRAQIEVVLSTLVTPEGKGIPVRSLAKQMAETMSGTFWQELSAGTPETGGTLTVGREQIESALEKALKYGTVGLQRFLLAQSGQEPKLADELVRITKERASEEGVILIGLSSGGKGEENSITAPLEDLLKPQGEAKLTANQVITGEREDLTELFGKKGWERLKLALEYVNQRYFLNRLEPWLLGGSLAMIASDLSRGNKEGMGLGVGSGLIISQVLWRLLFNSDAVADLHLLGQSLDFKQIDQMG